MNRFKTIWGATVLTVLAFVAHSAQAAVAPKISGAPTTAARVGETYAFRPQASDADGDTLRFAVVNKPSWATFDTRTGALRGTPAGAHVGNHSEVTIRVTDGTHWSELRPFAINVSSAAQSASTASRKATYGHYISTRYIDTPDDVAMLCSQPGVKGVVWRQTWQQVEPSQGVYDFSSYDRVLQAIARSHNPQCQVWIFIEFKSFHGSTVLNPCPRYLQAKYSARNSSGGGAYTCFMWEPVVKDAYVRMMKAAATRYDKNPRIEGLVLQESALSLNGEYAQDVSAGGTYTAEKWRDALVDLVTQCGASFSTSRCLVFLNFIKGGNKYLTDVSKAISAIPNNRGCMSGPDLLPDEKSLHTPYEVLVRHKGCRSNSAQNDSYAIRGYNMDQVFNFAVRGKLGEFDQTSPRNSGVCVNSYILWNHRVPKSSTGLNWLDALPVIAAYPYGRLWLEQCQGSGGVMP